MTRAAWVGAAAFIAALALGAGGCTGSEFQLHPASPLELLRVKAAALAANPLSVPGVIEAERKAGFAYDPDPAAGKPPCPEPRSDTLNASVWEAQADCLQNRGEVEASQLARNRAYLLRKSGAPPNSPSPTPPQVAQ